MTKLDLLKTVRSARRTHIRWAMKADALIHGIPLEKEQVPVNGTECSFGKWFYGEGQSLSALPSYKALEKPHFDLHSTMRRFSL